MADTGSSRPNQHYCIYCGAELRPGNAFCVSCGARLSAPSGSQDEVRFSSEEEPSFAGQGIDSSGYPINLLRAYLWSFRGWFRGLSTVSKLLVIALAVVLLITFSPLFFLAGVLLIVVSVIALIVRVVQRKPWERWGMVVAVAIIPTLIFGGISGGVYGFGLAGSGDSTVSDSSNDGVVSSYPSRDYQIVGEQNTYNDLGAEGKVVFVNTTRTVTISNIEDIMLDIDPSYTGYDAVIYHFRNPNTTDEGLCTTANTVSGSGMLAASTYLSVEGESVAQNYGVEMFYLDPGNYICRD